MDSSKGKMAPAGRKQAGTLPNFLQKLRKRRIIETLAAFIGGGWLLLEFVHWILVDHYHLPEKTIDVAFVTILGALIGTLIWRWFSGGSASRRIKLERILIPLVVIVTASVDLDLLIHLKAPEPDAAPARRWANSVAVLPFKDMSPQKDQDWFCDGITDEIIGRLSNISELKVPARTSVFFSKGKDQDVKEIGKKLGVSTVLEGSIQKVETRLRVIVELVNIADGFQIWSQAFNREVKDVFAIQEEIALAVTDKLKLTLLGEEKTRIRERPTIDPAAYEAYLRGLFYWWEWSDKGHTNALRHFQKAVEIEPGYAPAQAGLALAYIFASTWNSIGVWTPGEGVPRGKAAAQRAIELDPELADGYVARGYARMNYDWDWAGAEEDFATALKLSPRSSLALDAQANLLGIVLGRLDEAVAVLSQALTMDPLSPALYCDMGVFYHYAGQHDQARPYFRRSLELDSTFFWARLNDGWCDFFTGKVPEAIATFKAMAQMAPDSPFAHQALGYTYGLTGFPAEARKVLENLDGLAATRYVPPSTQASVYLSIGQREAALDWLEKAYAVRDTEMIFLKGDPLFAPLHDEPRFQRLLDKMSYGK